MTASIYLQPHLQMCEEGCVRPFSLLYVWSFVAKLIFILSYADRRIIDFQYGVCWQQHSIECMLFCLTYSSFTTPFHDCLVTCSSFYLWPKADMWCHVFHISFSVKFSCFSCFSEAYITATQFISGHFQIFSSPVTSLIITLLWSALALNGSHRQRQVTIWRCMKCFIDYALHVPSH